MAQKQILQLPKTQFSGLDFSNILEDVYNLVKENPEYNDNWNDFLSSNAGVMMTEIFAWITDQLATRIDWIVNENFIGTATQRSSIINLLKLIGYKFKLPVAAEVPVKVTFAFEDGIHVLTTGYAEGDGVGDFVPKIISAKDKKGNTKFFEAVSYDSSIQKYVYSTNIELDTTYSLIQTVNFYEGQTRLEIFTSSTNQGQIFKLSEGPVIRNSIQVILVGENEETLLEVDNFLSLKAQQLTNADGTENPLPYVINVLENDEVEIAFGSSALISNQNRRLTEGSTIKVIYRIGGGIDGNISRSAINITEETTNKNTITYINETEGVGSEDSETIEHAAYSGPLQIKTAGKTVTEEDYDIILSSFVDVLLSKAYGHNNIPEDFFEKYGIYINPLEVLNFIILKKSGWETIPTSKYKYANWGTFNLENYFNEKLIFRDGKFGLPLTVNSSNKLTLTENYDYNNQGGREFKNFMVIKTPQSWKDAIFIEDGNGDYIANPDLKASLTNLDYAEGSYFHLEDINDHFIIDNDDDPYFYGDYNNTGLPKQDIIQDINAYFQSKKDVSDGVFIGSSGTLPNQLVLNIDGHGDVIIDLSLSGQLSGLVPVGDVGVSNTVIDIINTKLAEKYNDVFAYQDFGVLIEDVTAVVPALENLDEDIWTLRIEDTENDPGNPVDYDISLGLDQSYESMLSHMNNAFGHGYQEFEYADSWTTTDAMSYEIRITVDTNSEVNISLPPMSGTTMYLEDSTNGGGDGLVDLLNTAFDTNNIDAIATVTYDEVGTPPGTLLGRLVRITSKSTGANSSISVIAGDSNSLLDVTGALKTAVPSSGADYGYIATFVKSTSNIACQDVRISRTSSSGKVLLSDGGTTTDILAAYGALPITTDPVGWGDYSTVARPITTVEGETYIRLESPNSGPNAGIVISESSLGIERDATLNTFGLDYTLDGVNRYECFGQRKLTIIYRDPLDSDFGDFIYEHGSIHFNNTSPSIDPLNIWLNYISSKKDTLQLGSYYTDNFEDTEPEWRLPARRIYNTIYELDPDSTEENAEKINYDVSNFIVEFTTNEVNDNSIYVINASGSSNTELPLTTTDYPTITSIDLSVFPDLTGKSIELSINDNVKDIINIGAITDITSLKNLLNSRWSTEANEIEDKNINFAEIVDNKIVLKIDNKKNTGKIVIYDDDSGDIYGSTLFNTTVGKDTTIYPSGDYYLEHYVPDPNGSPEDKFGYFNIKIIPNASPGIPDLGFYAHFVNDRRHVFLNKNVYRLHTDEDDLIALMKPYKIAGVDNSFKRPVFSTFDCKANVYISTAASKEQVKQNVDTALRTFYSLENTILSKNVNKSEFIGIVLGIPGVRYIDIDYFGNDFENNLANQDLEIVSGFDEILVLSDDVYDSSGTQTHGLIFQYSIL